MPPLPGLASASCPRPQLLGVPSRRREAQPGPEGLSRRRRKAGRNAPGVSRGCIAGHL